MINYGINNLWPTPVLLGKMADQELNDRMAEEILILKDSLGSTDEHNIFDTKNKILLNFKNKIVIPAFSQYMKSVLDLDLKKYKDVRMRAWITGWFSGYTMRLHNHHGSEFSGVFYILNEEQNAGGQIAFVDPRNNANRGYELRIKNKLFADVEYTPKSGEFLIFPSFLYHQVLPYYSNLRMAMPVDLFLGAYTE
jgi:hypothetical protein